MALTPASARGTRTPGLTFVTLETLPCGCVTALYRARPTVVEVDVVEAKGPHCRVFRHRAGQVIGLGVPEPLETDTDDALD